MTINLRSEQRPTALQRWAGAHSLSLSWRAGNRWAVLSGRPMSFDRALDVAVRDFRTVTGRSFYGARRQPQVPAGLRSEIASLGRIGTLPFTPETKLSAPAFVPPGGLSPADTLQAYDASPLAQAGYDGSGQTVVFFEWAPSPQADLDMFTQETGLPPMDVQKVGSFSAGVEGAAGETTLDLEVVHALAPKAKLVIVDATVAQTLPSIAQLFSGIDQQFPGAIWSLSIGWFCDKQVAWTDVQAIDQAIATAGTHGTSAYDASGDTDGLECKTSNAASFASPPSQDDVGLDGVASMPSMTSVGGTTMSVSQKGEWFGETVWGESAASQGTGGGASTTIPRPDFQRGVGAGLPASVAGSRLVPDVSAVADPLTGMKIVEGGSDSVGGGTSQAAPIWAGLTALMNQYLEHNGGAKVGAFNPLIYGLVAGHPKFAPLHDVTLGGNAVWFSSPGFDPATGWGTPDTWNLVRDILDYQKGKGR